MQETETVRSPAEFQSRTEVRWWWVVPVLLLAAMPAFLPHRFVPQATDTLLFILLAVSVNLLVGYGGMISLGHAAYFAIGGYTAALLVLRAGVPMPLTLLAGPLAAALAAVIFGFFCIRLTHAYFIMLTLAFGQLVYTVVWKWRAVTRGDDGLIGISPPPLLVNVVNYYYFTLAIILICLIGIYRLCQSPFGATLKAIRDNPTRAASIGIPVKRFQLVAFTLAGFFAGIAGSLYVFHHRHIFPGVASWMTSADITLMAVLGGAGYFEGPIVGAVVITLLNFAVPRITEFRFFVLGVVILLVAFAIPHGLVAAYHRVLSRAEGR